MTKASGSRPQIRAGIAGAGLMGRWHAHAIERVGGRVVAIMDPDQAAARSLAAKYPSATVHAQHHDALAAQPTLDVLHVCSPLATHVMIAEAALRAGIPTLIEKPMTRNAAESQHLLDIARDRSILACPVHQFLFQDGVRNALAQRDQIGAIVHLQVTICSSGGGVTNPAQRDEILGDILPHPFSLMQRFLHAPLPLDGWTTLHPAPGELRASAATAGPTLGVFFSMNARPTECALDLVGTAGSLHIDLYHGYSVLDRGGVGRRSKIEQPFARSLKHFTAAAVNLGGRTRRWEPAYPGLRNLVAAFYQAVRDGGVAPISPEEVIAGARLRDVIMANAGLAQAPPQ